MLLKVSNSDFKGKLKNPCMEKREHCVNCHSHFMLVRPRLKDAIVTKRFYRDLKDREKARSIVEDILNCSDAEFNELHKFEEHVNGCMIFRAKKEGMHIVYCVNKDMEIIFLRAFRNFKVYEKFLENKKEISRLIVHT